MDSRVKILKYWKNLSGINQREVLQEMVSVMKVHDIDALSNPLGSTQASELSCAKASSSPNENTPNENTPKEQEEEEEEDQKTKASQSNVNPVLSDQSYPYLHDSMLKEFSPSKAGLNEIETACQDFELCNGSNGSHLNLNSNGGNVNPVVEEMHFDLASRVPR